MDVTMCYLCDSCRFNLSDIDGEFTCSLYRPPGAKRTRKVTEKLPWAAGQYAGEVCQSWKQEPGIPRADW